MIAKHRRELGITIRCDAEGCSESIYTGNVLARVNVAHAQKHGWTRGGRGFKRATFCPAHAGAEPRWFLPKEEREANAKAARVAARARRKAERDEAKLVAAHGKEAAA